jgi:DNA repair protein RecN
MLLELHVKNLALIEQVDLEFFAGLTVLSGETGAGKSILIDSINLALGAKVGKDVVRAGADFAYIELLFCINDRLKLDAIRKMDIEVAEDGLITMSRKISKQKNVLRINGEVIAAAKGRKLMSLLIDIHSQHESYGLLEVSKQLQLIDLFAEDRIKEVKDDIKEEYQNYKAIEEKLSETLEENLRKREIEFLKYEIEEIEDAQLKEGEEQELVQRYSKIKNASRIADAMSKISSYIEEDGISPSLKLISSVVQYDEELSDIESQLFDAESIIADLRHSIYNYIDELDFNEEEFDTINSRLDTIRSLQGKYSEDLKEINKIYEGKKERLEFLENYEELISEYKEQQRSSVAKLNELCDKLSGLRKESAGVLKESIIRELHDLNFLGVDFDIEFKKLSDFTPQGRDSVELMISTNPGNPKKPLREIASGGELSRIMLAIKTVLADLDEVDTLIFDEIDTGISGRTAQKVSEKLMLIGRGHQVICITHLPQIAAMADHNYLIEKHTDGHSTKTEISYVKEKRLVEEIARLIGGSEITEAVLQTAKEMKDLADKLKG